MSKKSKKIKGGGLVYSTNKETMSDLFAGLNIQKSEEEAPKSITKGKTQKTYSDQVRVWIDRKQRGGKEVTLVKGISMPDSYLKELASTLKSKCGVGGSAKEGEIIIQGNHRDKVVKLLIEMGYINAKKAGG